ncbi:MAG: RNA ligase family protein [Deltaproteobacteria bacterium]|nr:RNA ligase family protein [Deltaproteobacteria bacterium]
MSTSKIPSFPKIFEIGHYAIANLFQGEVEITEKIDGSQFSFGVTLEGELTVRSKGKELFFDNPEKLFALAIGWVQSNRELILKTCQPGTFVYGEFLRVPKHNVLSYARVPKDNIMVFGVREKMNLISDYEKIAQTAQVLGLEAVPLIGRAVVSSFEDLKKYFTRESILGGTILEGIVVKNYRQYCTLSDFNWISMGKFVREEFKETLAEEWGKISGLNWFDELKKTLKTEARWQKAVQHLRDEGNLTETAQDIGKLMAEIERDFSEEEKVRIKEILWKHQAPEILRYLKRGFPEWYKEWLAKKLLK